MRSASLQYVSMSIETKLAALHSSLQVFISLTDSWRREPLYMLTHDFCCLSSSLVRWLCWEDQLCPDDPEGSKHQLEGGEVLTGSWRGELQQWPREELQQVDTTLSLNCSEISSTISHTMSSPTSISKCWGPGLFVSLTALPTAFLDLTIKETNATLHSSSKN